MRSFFDKKKSSAFRKCGVFFGKKRKLRLPQMRKIKKNKKKKLSAAGLEPGFIILPSSALPTTPSRSSLVTYLKITYIKKFQFFFQVTEKNYKIRFVGITDEIFWANFGVLVTSIFVKNSQKRKSILFGILRNCGGKRSW